MEQQELKVVKSRHGYSKYRIYSTIEAGNLMTMNQRIDLEVMKGYEKYSPKLNIKIGKVKNRETEFSNTENAQEFRTTSIDTLNKIINALTTARSILLEQKRVYAQQNWRNL